VSANSLWWEIIERASGQGVLRVLLKRVTETGGHAIATRIGEFLEDEPVVDADHITPDGEPDWKGFDDSEELERLIVEDRSTLLDVAFLARGVEIAPSICRLVVGFGGKSYFGTGLRITEDALLTNHHVLFNWKDNDSKADSVAAWFGYERDLGGAQLAHEIVLGDPATIVGDKSHDWAAVRMAEPIDAKYPALGVTPGTPVAKDDRVYIIQHPQGGPKQIGMHHNLVRFVDDNVIQYWTDTMGGSSGSPVFNSDWELVGLHHRYVKVTNGKTEIRNQGRRIERVREGLEAVGLT
jgi:endonuclease G